MDSQPRPEPQPQPARAPAPIAAPQRSPSGRPLGLLAVACFALGLGAAVSRMSPTHPVAAPTPAPAKPAVVQPQRAPAPQPVAASERQQSSPLPFFGDGGQVVAVGSDAEEAVDPLPASQPRQEGDLDLVPLDCQGCPQAVAAQAHDVNLAGLRHFRVVGSMKFVGMCGSSYLYRITNESPGRFRTTAGNLQGESWRVDLPPGGSMVIKSSHHMPDSPVMAAQ